jgi:hypothetical protein
LTSPLSNFALSFPNPLWLPPPHRKISWDPSILPPLPPPAMSYPNPVLGSWVNLPSDKLFAVYSTLIPLLPAQVQLWGFNLVNQYNNRLSTAIQDLVIMDTTYTAPPLSTLSTCTTQLAALCSLCICAV